MASGGNTKAVSAGNGGYTRLKRLAGNSVISTTYWLPGAKPWLPGSAKQEEEEKKRREIRSDQALLSCGGSGVG